MSLSGTAGRIAVGGLVLLLVTVLWWLFLFSPKRDAIDASQAEFDNAALRESTLRARLAELSEIRDNQLSYLFAIGQMESSIPATPQADAFIEDVTFLAESTGVTVQSISLTPPIADADTRGFEVPVAIAIEGEYFEILGFLYGIEALDRLVRVDGIQLNPIASDDLTDVAESDDTTDETADESAEEAEPRQRPNLDRLAADLSMRIFTRAPAAGSVGGGVLQPEPAAATADSAEGQ